ncbi:MAG: apolipoprotein N-acyltransferase [Pseudomonadota bacterium]
MSPGLEGAASTAGRAGWLARRALWQRLGLAALAGAAMTLGHPPISLPWVLFAALPLLVALVAVSTAGQAAIIGWAAGFGYFVAGLHWMGHAFLVDPERFAWAMPFAVTLMPAFLGLFWAGAFWLAHRLAQPSRLRLALALATALATAELARSTVLTGFPWNLPGYVWLETPVIQSVRWIGPHGLTLLTLIAAALPAAVTQARWAPGVTLALIALAWADGTVRLATPLPSETTRPVVRVVQPNAPQHLKWRPPHRERFIARLLEHSAAAPDPALGPPAAVIWPETAITFLPQDDPVRTAEAAASTQGATLIAGALAYERTPEGRRWTNRLLAFAPDATTLATYDKHHLVPFGEYMPLAPLMRWIGLEALADLSGGGLAPGPGPRTLTLPGLPAFAPAICYEIIFPTQVVAPGPRPDWIVHLTNDAWFGGFAGPQQHLAQARIRAIEQGLPVVRAANTGISAVIDARGTVVARIGLDRHGHADARLPPALPATLYARAGDLPALAGLALLWAGLALVRLRQRSNRA